ncbi:MAG TPA: hypothetical protein VFD92_19150 [Candidatus Binatia bacterium]|nr:hypothetical protein [Candidatus Binatia bacterium]
MTAPNADRCEILDPDHCLLPFPSDALTVADAATDTGRRVAFHAESMPANASGVHVDPTEWNRNDGFSPGAQITLVVPGLDPGRSGLPPVTDIARSLDPDSSLVLLDADTGERVIAFAELDAHATDPARKALLVHPARNLREGHRHVVALRRLVDADGADIAPSDVFRAYRDRLRTRDDAIEARRPEMERIFDDLSRAGVGRSDLYLAWDFTVASERSLSERLLHIRDDAFATLGDAAPGFTVTSTSDQGVAHVVSGTFQVPRYLTGDGKPGSVFNDQGADSLPAQNGLQTANFVCTVPSSASAANPARVALYGHGLLGTASQVVGVGLAGALVNVAFCATDWIGMAAEDVPNAVAILQDLGKFRSQADRLQQGHLNFLFLGRLMRHPQGLGSDPAFQRDGASVLDGSDVFFLGASQGGVLGGGTTAVAQDWTRAVLAVGASNYSLLIPRSVDFDEFDPILASAYPDPLDRRLGFGIIQMLWDRGESNAYLQHLTADPYHDTPVHDVLYFEAFADHQVANVGTEVASRTIGARLRQPALRPGRASAVEPYYGLEPVPSYPYPGSALIVWDFGTPPPPVENLPPREGDDPHGKAGDVPAVLALVSEYLKTGGGLVDVCGGEPCVTLDQ